MPIYYEANRYYLPITEIISKLGGKQILKDNSLTLELGTIAQTINLKENTYRAQDQEFHLKKKSLISGGIVYLSMFDFHKLFNLKVDWDTKAKTLGFYYNRDNTVRQVRPAAGKPALIRFEDVSASNIYALPESLEKLRIVSDYLYQENVPFHIAWVPRYIDPRPSSKADVDISKQYSMENTDFIYTLDYMLDRDGLIGLHGYTHQYGKTVSIEGLEFHAPFGNGVNIPATEDYAQARINLAKEAAHTLDIPYAFFEAPHYGIFGNQLKVAEKNFDIIYEDYPGLPSQIVVRKNGDKTTKYIPTPLNYVDGKNDVNRMINQLKNLSPNVLASFFLAPYLEFDNITLSKDRDGYPSYTYGTSVLHRLLKVFQEEGYRFAKITEL
ncbi:MAG: DUF2334 domain-containing protein [Desulfosporosinus sp.]|nr:DUF2334 domain-containing protein [Desulfosporosinus sp.]